MCRDVGEEALKHTQVQYEYALGRHYMWAQTSDSVHIAVHVVTGLLLLSLHINAQHYHALRCRANMKLSCLAYISP